MNPVEFYLSEKASLDQLDFQLLKPADSTLIGYFNKNLPKGNSLAFVGPVNISWGAQYRFRDGHLEIAGPFGAFRIPFPSFQPNENVEVCNDNPSCPSCWPLVLRDDWHDVLGNVPRNNTTQAKRIDGSRFEPLYATSTRRSLVGGRQEWVIIFIPEPHGNISKNRGGGIEISTPSGLVFEIPPGRSADLAAAGKIQWGLPGSGGAFVLGKLPFAES